MGSHIFKQDKRERESGEPRCLYLFFSKVTVFFEIRKKSEKKKKMTATDRYVHYLSMLIQVKNLQDLHQIKRMEMVDHHLVND